jgi:putative endonuclease
MFKVYAIENSEKGRIYIGYTSDVIARLNYHNAGYVKSTSKDKPWRLIAVENFESESEARWSERTLKRSRGQRLRWIQKYRIK